MSVLVRPARVTDDALLAALDRRCWSPEADVTPFPEPGMAFFREGHSPEGVLVADDGGTVIGWIRLGRPTPLESNSHVQQVQGLAVDPAARGSGVGRVLVHAAVDLARHRGARKVTLRVLSTNEAAQRLYGSVGFAVEGVLAAEFHLHGADVDDVLMALFAG